MRENIPMEDKAVEETVKPTTTFKKKRDIFRFIDQDDVSVDLGYFYKIIKSEKRVNFYLPGDPPDKPSGFFLFEDEEATKRAHDQILSVWSADVVE